MLWLGLAFAADWQVLETAHFRVHVPTEGLELGEDLTSRLERLRERIVDEIGFEPETKTEIVLVERGVPGGIEHQRRGSSRLRLYATPAAPGGLDGAGDDALAAVLVHHLTRIEHASIPPRAIQDQILLTMLGVAPIPAKSPAWLAPAYATYMEGVVLRDGRPHDPAHAAWLRELATAGELPRYAELSGTRRWRGELFASDVGSAYLAWLEEREPGSLAKVWARMTAKYPRTFNEAFQGVYRDRASSLYQAFSAELTARAMAAHRPSDTLWLHALGDVSAPAVSPDGRYLAFVHDVEGLPTLKVLETAVDEERVARRDAKIARILKRDPTDARAVDPRAPPHQTRATLVDRTRVPSRPCWLTSNTLLYIAPVVDGEGETRMEVFRWTLGEGPRRWTHGADVQRVDVGGGRVVGLRSRWGRTSIVEFDAEGDWTELVGGEQLARPRLSDDGQLAYLRNRGEGWRVVIEGTELPIRGVRSLAWSESGWIGEVGRAGRVDLYVLESEERLTSSGTAFAPEALGSDLFHLELTAAGFTIHKREMVAMPEDEPVRIGRVERASAAALEPVESRDDPVRLEPRILTGGRVGAGTNLEAGLRLGDMLGRNELAVLGSVGNATGAGAWFTNRTLPLIVTGRLWAVRDPAERVVLGGSAVVGLERHHTTGSWWVEGGGFVETGAAAGTLEAGASWLEPRGRSLRIELGTHGLAGWMGATTVMGEVSGSLRLGRPRSLFLEVEGAVGRTVGAPYQLGGVSTALRSPASQWLAIQPGWLQPGTAVGRAREQIGAAIGRGPVALMVERHRVEQTSDVRTTTLAAVRMSRHTERNAMLRMPELDVEAGIGCAFENDGSIDTPCQQLNDFRFWSSITWVP